MKKSRKRKITVVILIVLIVTISCYWYFVVCFNMLKFTQIKGMEEYCQFSGYNKGENVKIAVLDSGVNANHQDLSENIKEGYDFIQNKVGVSDDCGHGTWIAGIIGASDNNIGICGIVPKADIYPLKVLDDQGRGKIKNVVNAINWCIQEDIDVVNISFSTKKDDENLKKVVEEAVKKGIIVVASYDNQENKNSYPAQYENVIGVKLGKKIDKVYTKEGICYAPGCGVTTTDRGGGYEKVEGNSIATAYVTGNVALVVSKCKMNKESYNVDKIKKILMN